VFHFGVDYYPEHWPEARWPEDARLMADAGFNVVRLAEFAWSMMEPGDGDFDFGWLDRAIEVLAEHELTVILGTPTASPPPWLMSKYPEIYRVGQDGRRLTYGNRREYCPNNPTYLDYSRRITTRMADQYAKHPAVVGWQIDNEFGDRCYCPICTQAFHGWLQDRHGTLDDLNQKWGTVFWSHIYTDWSEIPVPTSTGGVPNPGLALDFYRFSSDSYVAYQKAQVEILRQKCPNHFITHNLMGFHYDRLNYFDLAADLDFVTWDNYRRMGWDLALEVEPSQAALAHDTMRGLRRQNFWVMEQQAGSGGWENVGVSPRPGELRLWTYQSIAHGADGILYFRWRTARHGTEQYWHGVLDHHGIPGRRYKEIQGIGGEIKKVGERLLGAQPRPSVAVMLCYDTRFAFQIQPQNPRFSYPRHVQQVYRALHEDQLPIDIVSPEQDLSPYRLVAAPALHIVSEKVVEKLEDFVRAGGVLLLTARSGVKDAANVVIDRPLPGLLSGLCGVEVEEYDSLPAGWLNELEFSLPELEGGSPVSASIWVDVLKPKGADVVAKYRRGYYAGSPAITMNRFGKGWTIYVGTFGDLALYKKLTSWLIQLAGLNPVLKAPHGIEVTERWQGGKKILFLLNHAHNHAEVTLDHGYTNLLSDTQLEGKILLEPLDVLVLEAE
jgi:beta-galactosidase